MKSLLFIFFNVRIVISSLVELKWMKLWQWNGEKKLWENLICTRDICNTYEIFKFILHQNFLRVCTKQEHMSVAQDYAKFKNFIVFGTKFVPLEKKTFVNIGNSFGTVITLYPWYINDPNSHFQYFFQNYLRNTKNPWDISKIVVFRT